MSLHVQTNTSTITGGGYQGVEATASLSYQVEIVGPQTIVVPVLVQGNVQIGASGGYGFNQGAYADAGLFLSQAASIIPKTGRRVLVI